MSNYHVTLVNRVGAAVQLFQEETERFDETAAGLLGLNRTDLRCLSVLYRRGAVSASEIATAAGLSRGAMTTALDRLERSGFVRRVPNPDDGRGVLVELTAGAIDRIGDLWGRLAREGAEMLSSFTVQELEAIARFLEQARDLHLTHLRRLDAGGNRVATRPGSGQRPPGGRGSRGGGEPP